MASAATIVPTEPRRASASAHRFARRAEIEREIEPPQHRGKPVAEIGGDAIEQKRRRPQRRRPPAAGADQRAVENQRTRRSFGFSAMSDPVSRTNLFMDRDASPRTQSSAHRAADNPRPGSDSRADPWRRARRASLRFRRALRDAPYAYRARGAACLALDLASAAALCRLPRAGRRPRALSDLLVEALLHHPALLRAAWHSVRL